MTICKKMVVCFGLFIVMTTSVLAQVPGAMTWQVSLDDGATWQGGDVAVSPSQTSVRVRLLASWDAGLGGTSPPVWFWFTLLDPYVADVGLNDAMSEVRRRTADGYSLLGPSLGPQRVGSVLKLDSVTDTALPGAGPGWFSISQGSGITGVFTYGNPIEILTYRLSLDGSLGTRTVSGVWAPNPSAGGAPQVRLSTGESVQATFHDARIIVPAPGAAGLGAAACLGLIAARRRRPC